MRRTSTPHEWRSGSEPLTARSDLRLRLLLSVLFTPLFALMTAGFALWSAANGPGDVPSPASLRTFAVVCGVLTLLAAVDLAVVVRRRRTER
ncbi:DUF6343 family protein [Kitasatospora sp. NPDC096147]|uniref:DUF6343 family protein n=1 Tax=Kitasatospora sp. NPDC096147 TaxID=3364093 RepID=UPI00380ADA1B